MAVDQYAALFGLGGGDTAYIYQCLDDIVESVYVVVIEYKTASRVFEYVGCFG